MNGNAGVSQRAHDKGAGPGDSGVVPEVRDPQDEELGGYVSAHDRAVAEAAAWVEANREELERLPGSNYSGDVRDESGESKDRATNSSSWMRSGSQGHPVPIGDDFEVFEKVHQDAMHIWQSRTPMQWALAEMVEAVLEDMDQVRADILRSYFFEGLSQHDLARDLGVSQPTVNKRLHVALSEFRRHLAKLSGNDMVLRTGKRGRPRRDLQREEMLAELTLADWRLALRELCAAVTDISRLMEAA